MNFIKTFFEKEISILSDLRKEIVYLRTRVVVVSPRPLT